MATQNINTPELKGHVPEIKNMHGVAEDELDEITQPTDLCTHTNELNPTELVAN